MTYTRNRQRGARRFRLSYQPIFSVGQAVRLRGTDTKGATLYSGPVETGAIREGRQS